jgi:hypothetical protein
MSLDPIVRRLHVDLDADAAFRLFTEDMATWWPLESHSRIEEGQIRETLVVEAHPGGRIFERMTDGTECDWGWIVGWEPGVRVAIAWKPNDEDRPPTEVEVDFAPAEGGGTDVVLEHRKWELLGPTLGAEARVSYASPDGWHTVLRRFQAAAGVAVG